MVGIAPWAWGMLTTTQAEGSCYGEGARAAGYRPTQSCVHTCAHTGI